MSRSLAIRRSKSSASSGERRENHMTSVAGAAIDGTQCTQRSWQAQSQSESSASPKEPLLFVQSGGLDALSPS